MKKPSLNQTMVILLAAGACVYALQILVFHDPHTTFFYLMQDLAFMPITIAVATLMVGEVMNRNEHRQQIAKTRMLTSSFFTEMGEKLMLILLQSMSKGCSLTEFTSTTMECDADVRRLQEHIKQIDFSVNITENAYNQCRELILSHQTPLLVLASNPMLMEHEQFTDLLWGIFHLIDEFRLRGEWKDIPAEARGHLEDDFSQVLQSLMVNWVSNARYLRTTYPNYYAAARDSYRHMDEEREQEKGDHNAQTTEN